jgi:three-Cys-motif partner protein
MSKKSPKINPGQLPLSLPPSVDVPDSYTGASRRPTLDREERFFGSTRTLASETKSGIVSAAFLGWAGVMLSQNPVALFYYDFFCGRGVYEDGSPSTPLELFAKITNDQRLSSVIRMVFNDRKAQSVLRLRELMVAHPGYSALRYPPIFAHGEVDEELVAGLRAGLPHPPSFAFLDPFGYKGITRGVLSNMLQDYGSDVLFFFNYHAIKRVLSNPNEKLRGHVEALLGVEAVRELRQLFAESDDERKNESAVLDALRQSMRSIDGHDVLTFAFRRRSGHASHHLAFVSKHVRGYQKAKEAMARYSSWFYDDDIPSLEYITPGYETRLPIEADAPSLSKLKLLLVRRLRGQRAGLQEAYDAVTFRTPYVQRNVRAALVSLVRDDGAPLYIGDAQGKLRGSLLPRDARVVIPTSLRRR